MICRHGILGRRFREGRGGDKSGSSARKERKGATESLRNRRIGRFKGENENLDRLDQARLTRRNGWSLFVHFEPPPLLFIFL